MDNNCIFCKIINGDFNTNFVYENEKLVAFNDINPQAPVHILFVPQKHIESLNELNDTMLVKEIYDAIKTVAKEKGISDYRVVLNTGKEAGQEVMHIHFHMLSGRKLNWPPG